ncbi:hypothetical protein [Rhizobium sp. PP-CC-3G-465]|uniref:hypothetical protein n=1 Tax=Rhizobium sp. PP-CC-3G-465 TaxID=2135648 RepID=UPI001049C775|nr:hypothetical protein C8J33_1287 [Rhizobium sp. PP-CC-3G-465]
MSRPNLLEAILTVQAELKRRYFDNTIRAPMFGPQHLPFVIRYLNGIDYTLSKKMVRKHPPDEPSLTNELCALLDADTQRSESLLEYNIDHLNADLAACGDGVDFEVTIDTRPHNSAMERHVSQSDFGLIVKYDNRILPSESWSTAYLVQAKRLFRTKKTGDYDSGSIFQATDAAQHQRMERLAGKFGAAAIKYCLYCPQTPSLSEETRTKVRALHSRNLSSHIYDFAAGLALRDAIVSEGGIDAGIWISPGEIKPSKLLSLHDEAFKSVRPFTWFFIEHFMPRTSRGRFGLSLEGPPPLINMREDDRLTSIISGNELEIRRLIDELAEEGEELAVPESITVLPRHTITINVTVGSSLFTDAVSAGID